MPPRNIGKVPQHDSFDFTKGLYMNSAHPSMTPSYRLLSASPAQGVRLSSMCTKLAPCATLFCFHPRSNNCHQTCGYAVPLFTFQSHRTKLLSYFEKKEQADRRAEPGSFSPGGLKAYWALKNLKSIDGLEALSTAHKANATPQCTLDAAEEKKPESAAILVKSRPDTGNIKFFAGLCLGIVLSVLYGRLVGVVLL